MKKMEELIFTVEVTDRDIKATINNVKFYFETEEINIIAETTNHHGIVH